MSSHTVKLSPFMKKLVGTMITSILTIACLIVMTSALAHKLGPNQFGAFSLIRRILNTIEPWVTLSLGISITRSVALSRKAEEQTTFLRTGFLIQTAILILTIGTGAFFSGPLTALIFRNKTAYLGAFFSFLFLTVCYSYFVLLYAYYRGIGDMLLANIWQIFAIAIGPMCTALFLANPDRLELILVLNGVFLGLAIFPLLRNLHFSQWCCSKTDQLKEAAINLMKYGLPRIPGSLIYGAILTIGPLGAPYFGTLKEAGYLVIGQSLLKIYESGLEGFSRVALPAISTLFSQVGKAGLRERVSDLISIILDTGFYLTLHNVLWTGTIVTLWLGDNYEGAKLPIMIMNLALCPYLAYVTLRAVLDAVEERAVTTGFLMIAFLATIVSSGTFISLGLGVLGLAGGTSVGFFVLGTLTSLKICKDFNIHPKAVINTKVILLNIILAASAWILKGIFYTESSGALRQIVILTVIEASCLFAYLYALNKMSISWFKSVKARIFSRL